MTVALVGQSIGPSIDELLNDISEYRSQTQLFCAKKRDELASIKHDYRKRKEERLQDITEAKQHWAFTRTKLAQLNAEWSADLHTMKAAQTELDELEKSEALAQSEYDTLARQHQKEQSTLYALQNEKAKQDEIRTNLQHQQEPELQLLESISGLKIEIVKADVMRFVFTHLKTTAPEEQCFITLDLSLNAYKLVDLYPYLPDISKQLQDLNERRDVFAFIKRLRSAFQKSLELPRGDL